MPNSFNVYSSTNYGYAIVNFFWLALVGILVKLFFNDKVTNDGSGGPATTAIWGYGSVILSLMGILVVISALGNKEKLSANQMFFDIIPLILFVFVLCWIFGIYLNYYKKINKGKVATEFYEYANISTFFVVLQLILLYNFIRNKIKITNKGDKDSAIAKMDDFATTQINGLSYIFTLINFILGGIMKIIVEYYSTDG
jgi:hypothetical protein